MFTHIFFTLLILILGLSIRINTPNGKKHFVFFSALILVLISGLRNMYVGPDDTYNYYNIFLFCNKSDFPTILADTEGGDIGFYILTKLSTYLVGNHFTLYLLLIATLWIVPIAHFINKYSDDALLSFILLLSLGFFDAQMVIIRQSLAISILLFAYSGLREKKLFKFFFFVLLASTFHRTALIFLLALPLGRLKINWFSLLLYSGVVIVGLTIGNSVFQYVELLSEFDSRFVSYSNRDETLSIAGFVQILLFLVVCMIYKKPALNKQPSSIIDYNFLFISLAFQGMVTVIAEFFRVSWYFKLYIIFLVPLAISVAGKNRNSIRLGLILLLLFYYLFMSSGTNDYAFFWETYMPNF